MMDFKPSDELIDYEPKECADKAVEDCDWYSCEHAGDVEAGFFAEECHYEASDRININLIVEKNALCSLNRATNHA